MHLLLYLFVYPTEIWGRIPPSAAMVRSPAALQQSIALRVPQRDTPSQWHLATGHILHHARWLQGSPHTGPLRPADISERHRQLPYAVFQPPLFWACTTLGRQRSPSFKLKPDRLRLELMPSRSTRQISQFTWIKIFFSTLRAAFLFAACTIRFQFAAPRKA